MELEVKIYSIAETNVVSDKFKKRDFIVVTNEQYPAYLGLQMNQDKCDILNNYKVGQEVKVSLNIKGRLWTNKDNVEIAFNTLECWRIEKTDVTGQVSVQAKVQEQPTTVGVEDDNLPF
jgi:hypothetical protein